MRLLYRLIPFVLILAFLLGSCSGQKEQQESSSYTRSEEVFDVFAEITSNTSFEKSEDSKEEPSAAMKEYTPVNHKFMKAVWLSQFDMKPLYQSEGVQREEGEFTTLLETVLDHLKNDGYNTIIVQVRPYADSFYPSDVYPVSNYISGSFGDEEIYDPFAIILSEAHERGFSVHAWLNPMRCMTAEEIADVPENYLIKQWYADDEKNGDYLVELNGRYYLNPAHEKVRVLIAAGAKEVSERYDIDGVHIDDYFYPTTDPSFDAIAYDRFRTDGGKKSLKNFRFENINAMVSGIYSAIKSVDERILFGISPAGNISNTYNNCYTDVYKWCSEESFLDYICPQIYFGLEHQTFDFKKVYNTWKAIIKKDGIRLIVGMTLGKAQSGVDKYAGAGKNEWQENKDVMQRCLEYLSEQPACSGISVFCYQYMYDPISGESIPETAKERANMKEALDALGKS